MMDLYGDPRSGNCQKVAFVASHLKLPCEWREIDVIRGDTRSAEFLALNPAGQVPVVKFDDGRVLAQSNAIMIYLAEGSSLIPTDAMQRGQMFQWLFWEQYSHEPSIAVVRFQRHFLKREAEKIDPGLVKKGEAALDLMERHLEGRDWFVGHSMSLSDIGLVAYTRWADEGGFDLKRRPHVSKWVKRVEAAIPV